MSKVKLKKDSYRTSRGGNSKILDITCSACNMTLFHYQKDGPGQLIRCYLDRIINIKSGIKQDTNALSCPQCNSVIGKLIIYKPEKRNAYVLIRGAFKKSIIA